MYFLLPIFDKREIILLVPHSILKFIVRALESGVRHSSQAGSSANKSTCLLKFN